MPLYHFNVRDGSYFPDEGGTELPSLDAAKAVAAQMAGDVIKDASRDFWSADEWNVEVTDARGLLLLQITAFGSVSAAGLVAERS